MKCDVLFFGATADAIGLRELEVNFKETATIKSIIDDLSLQHPALRKHRLLVAVNEQYSDLDTTLTDGDEIAIFTAVSGG